MNRNQLILPSGEIMMDMEITLQIRLGELMELLN